MTDGIKLDRDGTSVTLTDDLALQRQAGRPNSELQPQPSSVAELPKYVDKPRAPRDFFTLSGEFTSSNAESDANTLVTQILRPPLGRGSLTLTFQNGVWELTSYNVVPVGGRSGRVSWVAGDTGIVRVNELALLVVDNS